MSTNDDFFTCFSWAVPLSFGDSLGQCRFERGDIFYDSLKGYETWGEASKHVNYIVQVKQSHQPGETPQIAVEDVEGDTIPSEGDSQTTGARTKGSLFEQNWRSTTACQITDLKRKECRTITTTQGRLYTLLWKGSLRVLDEEDAPPPPATWIDLPTPSET